MEPNTKYTLLFLHIGNLTCKQEFIRHIYNLIQIPVSKGSTYNDLFRLLKERTGDEETKKAILEWIEFNVGEGQDTTFDQIITDEDGKYAIFDLVPLRE